MTSETDRVAIVTGAAGGLGSNVATLFANLGINVALVDIKEDALLNLSLIHISEPTRPY